MCVCVQVLYGLEEEGKEKSDDSRPLLGDNVPTSERAFWDIFGGSKLQNRGQCQCVANRHLLCITYYYSILLWHFTMCYFYYRFYSTSQVEQHVQTITLSTQCPSPRPPPNALPLSPVPPVTVTTSAGV